MERLCLGGKTHWILPLIFQTALPTSSPWPYISKVAGVGTRRPIYDQVIYQAVKWFLLSTCWPSDHTHPTIVCSTCMVEDGRG